MAAMTAGLTQELARFTADPGFKAPPKEAAEIAKSGFIDTAGVLVAGRTDPTVGIVKEYAKQSGRLSQQEASLFFTREKASSEAAVLINGVASHVLDYDDVGLRAHPSTVLVPAILAEAERRKLSGADALRAYIVGFEVWAELNAREPDALHVKGWHPTSTVGAVGAAAAAANLAGLNVEKSRNALALAASMAAGVVANFGSMSKSYQVARAAASGVEAARLAEIGMTGSADVLEHHAGLLAAMSPHDKADLTNPKTPIGKTLRLVEQRLSFKKYPMCYCVHRVVDAAIDIANRADLQPSMVDSIDVRIGSTQHSMLRNDRPTTGLEAKFSIEFAIAAGLTSRKVGIAELETSYVNRADIKDLITKVSVSEDDSVCPVEPAFAMNDRLVVKLKDGRVIDSGDIRFSRGHAMLPLAPGELKTKFMDCCRGANDIDAEGLFKKLSSLEELSDMGQLAQH